MSQCVLFTLLAASSASSLRRDDSEACFCILVAIVVSLERLNHGTGTGDASIVGGAAITACSGAAAFTCVRLARFAASSFIVSPRRRSSIYARLRAVVVLSCDAVILTALPL